MFRRTLIAAMLLLVGGNCALASGLIQVIPIFQLNEIYSDNINAFSSSGGGGDFFTAGVLGCYIGLQQPDRYLSADYETFGEKFVHNDEFDSYGHGHYFHLSYFDRSEVDTTISAQDDIIDNGFAGAVLAGLNGPPSFNVALAYALLGRNTGLINTFEGGATHRFSPRWSATLTLRQTYLSGSGYLQSGDLELNYETGAEVTLGGAASFYDFIPSSSGSPGQASSSNSQAYYPHAVLKWHPTDNLDFRATTGPILLNSSATTEGKFGFTVDLRYEVRRLRMEVGGSQLPNITVYGGGAAILRSGRGQVTYRLTRYTDVDVGSGYFEISGAGSDTQLITYGGGVTRRIASWINVYARYVALRRSNSPSAENVSNIFVIGASVSFEAFRWGWP